MSRLDDILLLVRANYTKEEINDLLESDSKESATTSTPPTESESKPVEKETKETIAEVESKEKDATIPQSDSITLTMKELNELIQKGATQGVEGKIETPKSADEILASFYEKS